MVRSEYEAIGIGGLMEVQYKPDNPKRILRLQDTRPKNIRGALWIGASMTAAGTALLLLGSV